jgi:hypothetical protein
MLRPEAKEAVTFFMSTLRVKKRRRTFIGPILLIAAGLLLIILMIWQLSMSAAAKSASAPVAPATIDRVELEEARLAVERGEAVFIDVRGTALYDSEHVPGALNIPLDEIESQLASLDPEQWYIPYCT